MSVYDQDAGTNFVDPWAMERAETMEQRLRWAGATDAEVQEFIGQWCYDATFSFEEKQRVWALGTGKLHAEVMAARADGQHDTETDADETARVMAEAAAARAADLRRDAAEMSAYATQQILEWVGDDVDRARAVLAVEEEHGEPRATLLAALIRIVGER